MVAVLASLESRGGSRFIHENLRCGSILHIGPPKNHFSLRQHDGETVLIAGGIGITPILCMYRELREHGNAARLLYLARRKSSAAFMDVISEIGGSVDLYFDDEHEGNTLPLHSYLNQFDADMRFYCCGPSAMLSSFTDACTELGFAHHYIERFRSDDSGEKDELSAFTVRLVRSDCELTVPSDRSILEVIENAGVDVNHSCRQGICGACETTVGAGLPDHRDQISIMAEREVNRTMMICVSRSLKPVISLDL